MPRLFNARRRCSQSFVCLFLLKGTRGRLNDTIFPHSILFHSLPQLLLLLPGGCEDAPFDCTGLSSVFQIPGEIQ